MASSKPAVRISLEELLLRHGAVTEEQLQRAREEQKTLGGDLGRALVHLGFIGEDMLVRAWAHQLGVPRVEPDAMRVSEDLLQAISVQLCETFGIIAVGRDRRTNALLVATSDPGNPEHLRAVQQALGEPVSPAAATALSIDRAIRRHYYGEPQSERETPKTASQPPATPAWNDAANPQVAALLARIEQFEQQTAKREQQIIQALRAIGDLLVEKGLVSREEYLRRARGKPKDPAT